jgi:hypothetical protein
MQRLREEARAMAVAHGSAQTGNALAATGTMRDGTASSAVKSVSRAVQLYRGCGLVRCFYFLLYSHGGVSAEP